MQAALNQLTTGMGDVFTTAIPAVIAAFLAITIPVLVVTGVWRALKRGARRITSSA